ncbi:hypothetical protein CC80DRAFT_567686 [Byssothecium circinans]|uniref:Uncharacterized protein n=1 Tax=Byssothecium circinans TaxID=147558 RepID=A0A6A5TQB3_9PLEO|nr:hypothetical protein CC80DRAFT_567686 [Byssothecium circinans]
MEFESDEDKLSELSVLRLGIGSDDEELSVLEIVIDTDDTSAKENCERRQAKLSVKNCSTLSLRHEAVYNGTIRGDGEGLDDISTDDCEDDVLSVELGKVLDSVQVLVYDDVSELSDTEENVVVSKPGDIKLSEEEAKAEVDDVSLWTELDVDVGRELVEARLCSVKLSVGVSDAEVLPIIDVSLKLREEGPGVANDDALPDSSGMVVVTNDDEESDAVEEDSIEELGVIKLLEGPVNDSVNDSVDESIQLLVSVDSKMEYVVVSESTELLLVTEVEKDVELGDCELLLVTSDKLGDVSLANGESVEVLDVKSSLKICVKLSVELGDDEDEEPIFPSTSELKEELDDVSVADSDSIDVLDVKSSLKVSVLLSVEIGGDVELVSPSTSEPEEELDAPLITVGEASEVIVIASEEVLLPSPTELDGDDGDGVSLASEYVAIELSSDATGISDKALVIFEVASDNDGLSDAALEVVEKLVDKLGSGAEELSELEFDIVEDSRPVLVSGIGVLDVKKLVSKLVLISGPGVLSTEELDSKLSLVSGTGVLDGEELVSRLVTDMVDVSMELSADEVVSRLSLGEEASGVDALLCVDTMTVESSDEVDCSDDILLLGSTEEIVARSSVDSAEVLLESKIKVVLSGSILCVEVELTSEELLSEGEELLSVVEGSIIDISESVLLSEDTVASDSVELGEDIDDSSTREVEEEDSLSSNIADDVISGKDALKAVLLSENDAVSSAVELDVDMEGSSLCSVANDVVPNKDVLEGSLLSVDNVVTSSIELDALEVSLLSEEDVVSRSVELNNLVLDPSSEELVVVVGMSVVDVTSSIEEEDKLGEGSPLADAEESDEAVELESVLLEIVGEDKASESKDIVGVENVDGEGESEGSTDVLDKVGSRKLHTEEDKNADIELEEGSIALEEAELELEGLVEEFTSETCEDTDRATLSQELSARNMVLEELPSAGAALDPMDESEEDIESAIESLFTLCAC